MIDCKIFHPMFFIKKIHNYMGSQTLGEEIQLNVIFTLKMLLMLFSTVCFCWSQTKASRSNVTVITFVTVIKSFN